MVILTLYSNNKLNEVLLIDFKVDDINHLKLSSYVIVTKKVPILHAIGESWLRICTYFFMVVVLLKISVVISPEFLPHAEHLMLNKPIKCWNFEIEHEKLLQKK